MTSRVKKLDESKLAALLQGAVTSALVVLVGALTAGAGVVDWVSALVAVVASLTGGVAAGLFRTRMVPDVASQLGRITTSVLWGVVVVAVLRRSDSASPDLTSWVGLFVALAVGMTVGIMAASYLLKRLWANGLLRSTAVVVGSTDLASELAAELKVRPSNGVDVASVINSDDHPPTGLDLRDRVNDIVERTGASRLIVAPFTEESNAVLRCARWAAADGLAVYVVPRLYETGVGLDSLSPDRVRGYPLVRVQRSAHPFLALKLKRLVDVVVSATGLLVLSPILLLAAIAVRASSPGPTLFRQERIGMYGRPITISKFRSMTTAGDPDSEWTSESRITLVGSVLRRTAIDELPQLLSVLRGDMSLVGPRPERPAFVEEFRRIHDDYDDRHRMPVGLTGLAQVVGLVGDTPISERVKYDNLYIDQWSLWGDAQIIVKTIWSIVNQRRYKQQQIDLARAIDEATGALPDYDNLVIDLSNDEVAVYEKSPEVIR